MGAFWALCNPLTGPLGPLAVIVFGLLVCAAIEGRSERK